MVGGTSRGLHPQQHPTAPRARSVGAHDAVVPDGEFVLGYVNGYGQRTERPLLARSALHAQVLSFPHPVTSEPVSIIAPWPKDLTVAVKYLRRAQCGSLVLPGT